MTHFWFHFWHCAKKRRKKKRIHSHHCANELITLVCKTDFCLVCPSLFRSLADVTVVLEGLWTAQLPQEVPRITGIRGGEFLVIGIVVIDHNSAILYKVPCGDLQHFSFSFGTPEWRSCSFWRSSWTGSRLESKDGRRLTLLTFEWVQTDFRSIHSKMCRNCESQSVNHNVVSPCNASLPAGRMHGCVHEGKNS